MKPIALVVVTLALLAGCSKDKPADHSSPPRSDSNIPTIHQLTWTGFDGRSDSDPQRATYLLDGETLGVGAEGLSAVKLRIAEMPSNSEVTIVPPYDPALKNPEYPFSLNDMANHTHRFGSVLSLAKPQPPTTQPAKTR